MRFSVGTELPRPAPVPTEADPFTPAAHLSVVEREPAVCEYAHAIVICTPSQNHWLGRKQCDHSRLLTNILLHDGLPSYLTCRGVAVAGTFCGRRWPLLGMDSCDTLTSPNWPFQHSCTKSAYWFLYHLFPRACHMPGCGTQPEQKQTLPSRSLSYSGSNR